MKNVYKYKICFWHMVFRNDAAEDSHAADIVFSDASIDENK